MNRYGYSSNFRRPERFSQFSVGDVVRPTDKWCKSHDQTAAVATIVKIDSNGCYLRWDNSKVIGYEDIFKTDQIQHERMCVCGHAEFYHAPVPAITHGECWAGSYNNECNCYEFIEKTP